MSSGSRKHFIFTQWLLTLVRIAVVTVPGNKRQGMSNGILINQVGGGGGGKGDILQFRLFLTIIIVE